LKFDLDPPLTKVILLGFLVFVETLIGGILVIVNEGGFPTTLQWFTILLVALLTLVTYFLTFLRTDSGGEL